MWDTIKCSNIHILGVPLVKQREKGKEKKFLKVAKNFPYVVKNINLHIQGAQQTLSRISAKRLKPTHEHYSQNVKN